MKSIKYYVLLFLKGMGMGSADVVPGVSGGTIAFITGIYEELLASISSFDLDAFKLLTKFKFKELWKHINGQFLLPLIGGILVSVVSLAKIISHLLETQPIMIWSFFFGLVIISSISVAKEISKWNALVVLSGLVGIAIAFLITIITPATTPNGLWFIFISGAIAICAMILPGISGSFILLILGKYAYIVDALNDLDFGVIIVFALGCITGLLSFSRAISWFLKKFHNYAVALLAGFMIGSLNKIWPWKKPIRFELIHGEQVPTLEKNILPTQYLEETGNNPMIVQAILFMALGFMLVIILEKVAILIKNSSNKNAK
ncbi:DUF368 domain-containing protein [Reichenbachiella ulvae]|uniref:DUF368 domain-containing protein n=1 Tax=Reichenbachiella ulvae TaxID=2980104 RepID=A0ABT3CP84_9BACT|nr:DUF368 domain-containing protein [Reichenbachiella ulvae]MCV9385506.1 DUF368 domain-containing protein [Reichenbachiella ulvae]